MTKELYTFKIKHVSTKKYDPQIERTTIIKAPNLFICQDLFKKSFKESKPIQIDMIDNEGNVVQNLLNTTEPDK